jgi:hypothetical protein
LSALPNAIRWSVAVSMVASLFACAASSVRSSGRISPCHTGDAYSTGQIAFLRKVASSTEPNTVAWRLQVRLPADTNVVSIIEPSVCGVARRAYERDADLQGKPATFVYLLRIGDVYVVSNPSFPSGEFVCQLVYDDQFRLLSAYLH